jgi:replicative DNA helicase
MAKIELVNREIEKALAGCLLIDPQRTLAEVERLLRPEDVFLQEVQAIYRAVIDLAGREVDMFTVLEQARRYPGGDLAPGG